MVTFQESCDSPHNIDEVKEVKSSCNPGDGGVYHHDLARPPRGPHYQEESVGKDQRCTSALVPQPMLKKKLHAKTTKSHEIQSTSMTTTTHQNRLHPAGVPFRFRGHWEPGDVIRMLRSWSCHVSHRWKICNFWNLPIPVNQQRSTRCF